MRVKEIRRFVDEEGSEHVVMVGVKVSIEIVRRPDGRREVNATRNASVREVTAGPCSNLLP